MDGLIGREGGRGSVEALLRLALTPGLGPRTIRASLEGARTVDAVLARVERTHRLATSAEAEGVLAACRRDRVTTTGLDGTDYPEPLRHLPDPPPVVFHRGELGVLTAPRVVIVGSRQATAYGRRVAGVLAAMSARAGWTVVSGMALGIDGAAHRGALDAGGATAAVLGSGPDRPSPTAHRRLATAIAQEGVLLSELPPGTPARPHHFPRRNRLLAALADRVVVVEAAKRSGALITARLALELGREVWAVPGPVFSPVCEGTHLLLEDGARPVVTPARWRTSLDAGAPGEMGTVPSARVRRAWDEDTRTVWRLIGGGSPSLDELVLASGLSGPDVLRAITVLELGGFVRRDPGPVFTRRAA